MRFDHATRCLFNNSEGRRTRCGVVLGCPGNCKEKLNGCGCGGCDGRTAGSRYVQSDLDYCAGVLVFVMKAKQDNKSC